MRVQESPARSLLGLCLVEGDEAAVARARCLRCKSLLLSVTLECALLAALVLVPLLATGRRLVPLRMTPIPPPPHGHAQASDSRAAQGTKDRSGGAAKIYLPPRPPDAVVSHDTLNIEGPEIFDPMRSGARPLGVIGGTNSDFSGWQSAPHVPAPPTPSPLEKRRRLVSEGVQQALLVHRVEPVYPILAKQARIQGTVQLHALIGRDGAVRSLEVLSGQPILARAAIEAVGQWRYQPTLLNGEPVEVETYITVIFQLEH